MLEDAERPPELSPVKQALLEIRRLTQRVNELEQSPHAPVAVIGAGLRFPGKVNNLDQLWDLLANGVHAIGTIPADRWDVEQFTGLKMSASAQQAQRYGGFLDDIQGFDAHFFGISPREAETMDPQQRLLLEVAWEALEDAGQAPDRLFDRPCGVFLGICGSDYYRMLLSDPASIDHYTTTGNALSVAAGRISYLLGLHGPNLAVDTACSSSLVALHLAVNSLRREECDLALVGGVNLILTPEVTQNFANANMLAEDGRCKTFDAAADGYVRSEGCAVIVLKRLAEAQLSGDRILGVVRGTAVNHDGRSGGLTAPNGPAQEAVIAASLADAGVEAGVVGYVETHGTGTALGDPIEAGALAKALCQGRDTSTPLRIGSIKTNLGHLEAAAGLAGLLKALLVLQQRCIPPHLHLERVSPYLQLDGSPIDIPTQLTPWQEEAPLVAGVSSFGLSGTNAHIIIGAAPSSEVVGVTTQITLQAHDTRRILPLSARSQPALHAMATRWENYLAALPEQDFASACRVAGAGRNHFDHRLSLTAATLGEARLTLREYLNGVSSAGVHTGTRKPGAAPTVAFLFTGQGLNYAGMGRDLYTTEPVFRSAVDECAELFAPYLEKPLLAALYPDQHPAGDKSLLNDMAYAQAGLFALQIALARLWTSWGVQPAYLLGHSAGEYPAAVLAEVFRLEDAVRLVTTRSRLLAGSTESAGRMASVFAEAPVVEAAIAPYPDRLSVAAYNGPKTVVISGERKALDLALDTLSRQRVKWRMLEIAQAAHSPLIERSLEEFLSAARLVNFSPARSGFASTVLGRIIEPDEIATPDYWRNHLRQPVRFSEALLALYEQEVDVFIEIGPSPALLALGERCLPKDAPVAWLPSLRSGKPDRDVLLDSLAKAYVRGAAVDWEAIAEPATSISAPTYPFQRERYWAAAADTAWKKPANGRRLQAGAELAPSDIWKAVASAGERQAAQGPLDLAPASYAEIWQRLDQLSAAYMLKALRELGVFAEPGAWLSPEQAAQQGNILPVYRHLLANWLRLLARKGFLEYRDGVYCAAMALPEPDIAQMEADARGVLNGLPFLEKYLLSCGAQLADVLTGKVSPLVTLFPGGSFELADALYGSWSLSRYFSELIRAGVDAYIHSKQSARPVHILEIGAGTGGTTQAILPELDPQSCIYTFTDVSDLFLTRAAEKFGEFPLMRYALLDIEKAPGIQGFPAHGYDVVIAANVLHATNDLRHTLANVKQLLTPGGILLATEATTYLSWFDISTGLIAGWQRFDDGLRQDTPLLPARRWMELLHEMGFEQAAAWPADNSPAAVLGQSVLAAMGPTVQTGADVDADPGSSIERPVAAPAAAQSEQADAAALARQLRSALVDEREELLMDLARQELQRILRLSSAFTLDGDSPLHELGVDSLMSLELRRNLAARLDLSEDELPSTLAFDHPTPKRLVRFLSGFFAEEISQPAKPSADPDPYSATPSIEDLTEDEVAALLMARLKNSKV